MSNSSIIVALAVAIGLVRRYDESRGYRPPFWMRHPVVVAFGLPLVLYGLGYLLLTILGY